MFIKANIEIYLIIFLFFIISQIQTSMYLRMELVSIDDCITKIYTNNNISIHNYSFNPNKIQSTCYPTITSQYPEPLINNFIYEFEDTIYFEAFDNIGPGSVNIKTTINEYIIEGNNQKFLELS